MANDFNIWGEISIYTDADALEDGTLIDVSGYGASFNGRPINRATDNAFHTLKLDEKQPVTVSNNLKFIAEIAEKHNVSEGYVSTLKKEI